MSSTQALFLRHYYSRPDFVDGTQEFHQLCDSYRKPGGAVLEIGAGPENATSRFLAQPGPLYGADVEGSVADNPYLRELRLIGPDGRIDYPDASFELCVSNWVLEHVADPVRHFQEVARVLAPGGHYCFRTPNQFHYVALAARLTPFRIHETAAAWLRGQALTERNCWPTCYRANTGRRLRQLAAASGLQMVELRQVEKEPCYGRVSPLVFWPMLLYERAVNRRESLAWMRSTFFGVMRRS